MTTVETRVVDPVGGRAVRSVEVTENDIVDAALTSVEDDKILVDEELTSCEDENLEDQLLTVALVNSVVDSGAQHGQSGNPQSPRYGLRKRRRPGESGPSEASDGNDPMAPSTPTCSRTAMISNGRLQLLPHPPQTGAPTPSKSPQRTGRPPQSSSSAATAERSKGRAATTSTLPIRGSALVTSSSKESVVPLTGAKVQPRPLPAVMPLTQAGQQAMKQPQASKLKGTIPKKATASRSRTARSSKKKEASKPISPAPISSGKLVATSGAVPNPLLHSTPTQPAQPFGTSKRATPRVAPSATSVPCPLPPAVPCPLPSEKKDPPSEKRVTISEPPATTRNRIFSVDLDPATFDFSGMAGDHSDMGKAESDMADITGPSAPDDLALLKRDRAFSFEFFSFAGDDLLPAPPAPSVAATSLPEPPLSEESAIPGRPRGDSIIFDPSSFQDGGIHEKNAILKVNAAKNIDATPPSLLADSRLAAPPQHHRPQTVKPPVVIGSISAPLSKPGLRVDPAQVDNGQLATLPSGLTVGNQNANSPATFQMELLNKDGRIGIYLPEARRARIARFHAKRKMRIWRKRIKYDCRKKLADSRPRIKGRFVKRSDMDE